MNTNSRLPHYDSRTHRLEASAFLGLALAGSALLALAFGDAFRFSTGREAIIAALEAPQLQPPPGLVQGPTNQMLTNLTAHPPAEPGNQGQLSGPSSRPS